MKNQNIPTHYSVGIPTSFRCFMLCILISLTFYRCKKEGGDDDFFPVNEDFARELTDMGIPADIARFYAAAKMESSIPNDTTCIYLQTFPNGATREMTLQVSPNRRYYPTAEEIAGIIPGQPPIYAFTYSSGVSADGTTRIQMDYYVADASFPGAWEPGVKDSDGGSDGGAGISWTEIGKTGADVSIGSLLDYAKDHGIKVSSLASIYAMASALSNMTTAMELSKQNSGWMKELDDLENCAANPTNPVSKSDPRYSPAAVAKIQSARSELQQVNSVRFLNMMTETGAGITPVTAVMSIGMKQGFVWSENTLNNYSESTIMREARLAVVPCNDHMALEGNIDVVWECSWSTAYQTNYEMWHVKTSVKWVPDEVFGATGRYFAEGTYIFEYLQTATAGGITCTDTKNSAGSIAGTGILQIITDPAAQNVIGFAYSAAGEISTEVAAIYGCGGSAGMEGRTILWLPDINGFPGTGGVYEGELTRPSCVGGNATGSEKIKWSFSVPPLK